MCNSERLLVVLSLLCETSQNQLPIFDAACASLEFHWCARRDVGPTRMQQKKKSWSLGFILTLKLLRLTSWNHLLQLQLFLCWKQPNQLVSKSCRLWLCQQKNWVRRIICFKIRFQRWNWSSAMPKQRISLCKDEWTNSINWLHQWTNLCTGDSTLYRKGRSWKKD